LAIERTELSDQLLYGIDFKARIIHFGVELDSSNEDPSAFTGASVEMAIRAIQKMVSEAPHKPIELHVSSYGGDAYAALRLHDEILACSAQIRFYGGGAIMSAASIIMAACDERYLHVNSRVMIHELSTSVDGRHSDLKIDSKENEAIHSTMCDIYAANSRLPKEFWLDIMSKDLYMSAAEAVSIGLCDFIIEPKKRGNLRKKRQVQMKKEVDLKKLVKDLYDRTGRSRVPRIELNAVIKEPSDSSVVIDSTPMETKMPEFPAQLIPNIEKVE